MKKSFACVAFALVVSTAIARADDLTAPPAGLKPATATLAQIFASYGRAIGKKQVATRSEHWTLSFGGVAGTRTILVRNDDFRIDETRGQYHSAYGTYRGRTWHMNENGQVVVESDLHQRDEISTEALRSAKPGSKTVTVIGRVETPVRANVVRVDPPGGRLKYLFFDERTGLLDRVEQVREDRRQSLAYDDFRTTNGYTRAWHVTIDDGHPNNVRDEHLVSLDEGQTISDDAIVVPSDQRKLISLAGPTPLAIPAKIISDRIILPFHIGSHTVDFQLDSGASGIVINRDVATALKLPQSGRVTGETAGEYVESDVTIDKMTVGDLTLSNVAARSLPFANMADDSTPVAGLMGFDFIESAIVHIDYQHGTVELIDPGHFTAPPDAAVLPIALDDDVPQILMRIGDATKLHFMIDTGADRSLLFTEFAQSHPHDVSDQGLGTEMRASSPFLNDISGVGGEVAYQPVQVAQVHIGSWTFPRWLFYLTKDAPAFEGEDYDGLIGQDMLRNYDVYFDYSHQRIYLKPNDRYRDRWGT